jgi:hypothetical protein
MSEKIYWLLIILIAACVFCFVVHTVHNTPSTTVEMAKAGYVQKVVVIGYPFDPNTRRVETVWVRVDDTPTVENKQ